MAWAHIWEEVFSTQAWGKYPTEDLIRFVAQNFYRTPRRNAVKLLEVGCGPGANLWYLAREGFAVYGIDGSSTAIGQATDRLDRECPGWQGSLHIGDMGCLPFPDNNFDAVVDCEAVATNSHDDARTIYHEMYRVCRPGGKMLSITFAEGCYGEKTGREAGHHAWYPDEGPLGGHGFTRFTTYEEIPDLLGPWTIIEINQRSHSRGGLKEGHVITEWLIEAAKGKEGSDTESNSSRASEAENK